MQGWTVRLPGLVVVALLSAGCGAGTGTTPSSGRATTAPVAAMVDAPDDLAPFVTADWAASGGAVGQLFGACVSPSVPRCYRQADQAASHIAALISVLQQVTLGPDLKQSVGDLVRDLTTVRDLITGYQQFLLGTPGAALPRLAQTAAATSAVNRDASGLTLNGWAVLRLPQVTPDPRAGDGVTASTPAAVTPPPSNCLPAPCEHNVAAGTSLLIDAVNRRVVGMQVTPYAGTHFVEVSFSVTVDASAPGSVLVSAADITVTDGTGRPDGPAVVDAPGCAALADKSVDPGTYSGPQTACFQVQGPVDGPLSLNWKPGPVGVRLDLALP